jgi:hypothetical protein
MNYRMFSLQHFLWWQFCPVVSCLAILAIPLIGRTEALVLSETLTDVNDRRQQQWLAGADGFNPSLQKPDPTPSPATTPPPATTTTPLPTMPPPAENTAPRSTNDLLGTLLFGSFVPLRPIDNVSREYQHNTNSSGQVNQSLVETTNFSLSARDKLRLRMGVNYYEQPGATAVNNFSLQVTAETQVNSLKIQPMVGVDLFNNRSQAVNWGVGLEYPLFSGMTLSADLESGVYKFNARTIASNISAVRYGPSLFWQIDRDTTLFSAIKFGNYSDGNIEQQSFSRLERKFGDFNIAANLFTWGYRQPTNSGYFTPGQFSVFTRELGWEGDVISNVLRCRIAIPLGEQNVDGKTADASGYQGRCTAKISRNIEAELGYSFSNVRTQGDSPSQATSQSIMGRMKIVF